MGTDGASFATVLVNSSDPETSVAGWIVGMNATGQTLTVWNAYSGTLRCSSSFSPYPGQMVPGFAFCPGGPTAPRDGAGSLFPHYMSSYAIPGSSTVNWWSQMTEPNVGALFAVTDGTCVPLTLLGQSSPLGGGSFSVTFLGGQGSAPPATWSTPPSGCNA